MFRVVAAAVVGLALGFALGRVAGSGSMRSEAAVTTPAAAAAAPASEVRDIGVKPPLVRPPAVPQPAAVVVPAGTVTLTPGEVRSLARALVIRDPTARWQRLREFGIVPTDADFVAAMPSPVDSMAQIRQMLAVLDDWMALSPEAAMAWVMGLPEVPWPDCRGKNDALYRFVAEWALTDPPAVERWIRTLPPCRSRDVAISRYVSALLEQDATEPQVLAGWCAQIGDPSFESNVATALARKWCAQDLDAGAQWINSLPLSEGRDMAMSQLAREMAPEHPVHAMAWAVSIRDERWRTPAIGAAMQAWTKKNPSEAATILNEMPDDRARDEALRSFCGELSKTDPPLAMQWAETIEDMGQRQTTMLTVCSSWVARDRAAALRWLDQSPLPPWARQLIVKEAGELGSP